jgi:5-hydroxyisourate hydrolase-like protein (transthyretin family)
LHVDGFNFPASSRAGATSIIVQVPPGAPTFAISEDKKTYKSDFSIVVLIKNEAQQVVQKLSNQYVLTGPIEKLDAAKHSEILFYRSADLPPGRYSVAAAAYDAVNGQASVNSEVFEVQSADESSLRLSSVAILKRAEKLPETERNTNNPFRFGEVLVYPNLGESLHKSTDKELAFYLTAYVKRGTNTAPKLTVELLQQRRSLGLATLEMPKPDASGRIQYASELPVDKLQAGDYELRVTVSDGTSSAVRLEHFSIQ